MNDLRNQLVDSAHSFDVTEASSVDLQRRARRRSQRSNAVKATAVLAVAGVGVYGVARLSDPGGDVIVTSASPDGASTANGGAADGSAPNASPGAAENDPFAGLPQTRDAEFIPGGYDWAAYRADSPEGLALRFNPDETYALGTSAGTLYETSVYKQTDGSWEPIVDLGLLATDARTNDAVYAIKRGDDNEPASEITKVDLSTGAESVVPYPEGARVAPQQVGRVKVNSDATLAARGDMVALLVDHWLDIDASEVDLPPGWVVGEVTYGSVYAERKDCPSGGTEPTTAGAETTAAVETTASVVYDPDVEVESFPDVTILEETPGAGTEPPLDRAPTASDTRCEAIFPVDELPLTEEERAATNDGEGLWTLRSDQWTHVELPDPSRSYSLDDLIVLGQAEVSIDEDGVREWVGDRYFAVTDANQIQPLFGGNVVRQQSGIGVDTSGVTSDTVTKVNMPYVLTQKIGTDEWHATDLRTLGVDSEAGPLVINSVDAASLPNGGVFAEAEVFIGRSRLAVLVSTDGLAYRAVDQERLIEATGLPGFGLNVAFRGIEQRGDQIVLRNDSFDSTTGESLTFIFVGTPR